MVPVVSSRAVGVVLAIFETKKGKLLGRVKKRDWRDVDGMKELFTELADQDLKVGDLVWMLADPDRMVRHYATQIIVTRNLEGATAALLKELR